MDNSSCAYARPILTLRLELRLKGVSTGLASEWVTWERCQ